VQDTDRHRVVDRVPLRGGGSLSDREHVTRFVAFPEEVRRVIDTSNAIEALSRQRRKAITSKATFPTRTPPASSSTLRCRSPLLNGRGPGTGRPRGSRARSSALTPYPVTSTQSSTPTTDNHTHCHSSRATETNHRRQQRQRSAPRRAQTRDVIRHRRRCRRSSEPEMFSTAMTAERCDHV
jgi:hypothetical protein